MVTVLPLWHKSDLCQYAIDIYSNTTLFSNFLKMMILISSVESLASFKQKSFYRIKIVQ